VIRTPVQSSAIRSIGHDGSTLEVEMSSGQVYRYEGVERTHFEALLASPSIGKEFHARIKGGGFAFAKVEPDPKEKP